MKGKIRYVSIITIILLIISVFPNIQSISTSVENNSNQTNLSVENKELDNNLIEYKIYHIKGDGSSRLSKRTLTNAEINSLKEELEIISREDATLTDIYMEKYETLKKYDLIPDGITSEDIIDPTIFKSEFNVVSGEDFNATTAPLFFFGGGIGVGLGVPFFVTAGTFLVALFGFGLAMCYDIHTQTLYQLITFTLFPILIGILNGFVGLLMIPVVPGFVYSNFFALGAVAKTRWIQLLPF
jgi:hypothetical protein